MALTKWIFFFEYFSSVGKSARVFVSVSLMCVAVQLLAYAFHLRISKSWNEYRALRRAQIHRRDNAIEKEKFCL